MEDPKDRQLDDLAQRFAAGGRPGEPARPRKGRRRMSAHTRKVITGVQIAVMLVVALLLLIGLDL